MAKKLLSPELNKVLKDIESAREVINEKYKINGFPNTIPSPLLSGDLAARINDIFVLNSYDGTANPEDVIKDKVFYSNGQRLIGCMKELHGDVFLTHESKEKALSGGFYKEGVKATLTDYAISYIFNRQGLGAKVQYTNIDDSFTIPDFGITEHDGEKFQGWSHMPNDEDPEYLTGDIVPNYQYKPTLKDPSYVSCLYAVWKKLLKLSPITLSLEYANNGLLDDNNQEIVTVTVSGQPIVSGLERSYTVEGNPQVTEDVETGKDWYKHQFIFNQVGAYPVMITHSSETGTPEVAADVIKIFGTNGSLSGGEMTVHGGKGSWYDSGWLATSIMKGVYITSAKLSVKFQGHGGGVDALAVFIKNTNGDSYIIYDFGNIEKRLIDITDLGTLDMVAYGPNGPLIFSDITLQRKDLGSSQHYIPGPLDTDVFSFVKEDDVRQVRFFVFSSHTDASCFAGAVIDYDVKYEFDMDLWELDKKDSPQDPMEKPVDMRLQSLKMSPGSFIPEFNTKIWDYKLTVPQSTTAVTVDGIVVDSRAKYNINNSSNRTINIQKPDGTIISKFEINVFAKDAYSSLPVTNATDNDTGKYTIEIAVEKPVIINPDMPATRETATINLPSVPSDFSEIPINSNIEYKYGWWEICQDANADKLKIAYTRIYNMFLNNGQSINGSDTYTVTDTNGNKKTNLPLFCKLSDAGGPEITANFTQHPGNPKRFFADYTFSPDTTKTHMMIYLFDLELTMEELDYVLYIVMADCPELLFKFQKEYLPVSIHKQWTKDENGQYVQATTSPECVLCLCTDYHFPENMRQTMMQTCVDTLNDINKIIDDTYGIKFGNKSFKENNEIYTTAQMAQIGKVIHDYIEAYNVYGNASGHYLNQTMYPALSRGIWNPVCASYARALQYCCWRWGINALNVEGICDADGDGVVESESRHAWSLVSYQNKPISEIMASTNPGQYWQEVDCTWDDSGPATDWDYGNTTVPESQASQDLSAITNNTAKTTGWNDTSTCRWDYFNITTADINSNAPDAAGTSGGAGCREREVEYKNLIKGTGNKYTYNGSDLYKGFEKLTD